MNLIRDLDQLPERFRRAAVSIGNFDGVHRGHARIVERLSASARRLRTSALVFTFDPHPARILCPEKAPSPLIWTDRKAQLLGELGADAVVAYPTDRALLGLDARQFFDRIVRGRLQAQTLVEGPNFFFGRDRTGSIGVLQEFCADVGMALEVVEPIRSGGEIVSSSHIRRLISAGRLEQAGPLLTQPYRIRGTVIHGAGRGVSLGYPTANLGQVDTLLPGEGIYAGRAWVAGARWPAAVSIGPNPTFDDAAPKVEIYLIGLQGSLYDQVVEVDFLARLRDIKKFNSAEELVREMDRDVAAARRIVEQY
ncbi:MAG: bifunctional riboflavin kinase/FAD synthetase, partial [Planctomycetota bacterium]